MTEEQINSRPWLYKKGQSGNPGGRPKGSVSMKTWLAKKLATMTEEERELFIEGQNKIDLFKMAEGNPESKTDITSGGEKITAINYILPDGDNSAPNQETTPSIPGAEQS